MKLLLSAILLANRATKAVRYFLPRLRETLDLDFIVANGENSAGGSGITPATASEIFEAASTSSLVVIIAGISARSFLCSTTSPVLCDRKIIPRNTGARFLCSRLVIASDRCVEFAGANFHETNREPVLCRRAAVDELREQTPIILVDMHAETTSEKIAMGRFLDGRVSAVIGTHTHVQTADEHILGGTAFLCDAGAPARRKVFWGERSNRSSSDS